MKALAMRGMKALNVFMTTGLFVLCWRIFYIQSYRGMFSINNTAVCLIYSILIILLMRTYNAFTVGVSRVSELIYSLILSDFMGAGIFYFVMSVEELKLQKLIPLVILLLLQTLWNIVWSIGANKLYFHIHKPKATAIVYRRESDLRKLREITYFKSKFNVKKYIENPQDIHQLIRELEGYDVIFVVGIHATLRNGIAKYCVEKGVQGYIAPHVGDVIMAGAKHMCTFSVPIMRVDRAALSPEYAFVKRGFDIVASLTAIIVTWPVMLIVALAIKCYDRGPVLFKQIRLTKNGREFRILKFRSMKVNAEQDGIARLASECDERITPVGKIIRAYRLDELPQLFNILKGDMTIVGPRPERPEIAAQYEAEMSAFSLRLQVKAGLTGFAQIYGRYNTEPYDKLQMDLMYINSMSVVEDLRLMLATVKVLFMPESTAGVEKGQVTAAVKENMSRMPVFSEEEPAKEKVVVMNNRIKKNRRHVVLKEENFAGSRAK